jgi:hypothetical protein
MGLVSWDVRELREPMKPLDPWDAGLRVRHASGGTPACRDPSLHAISERKCCLDVSVVSPDTAGPRPTPLALSCSPRRNLHRTAP